MVTATQIAIQLLNGLSYGSVLVLAAMGLTIIFGLLGIVNFAHGAFYGLGAYVGLVVIGLLPNGIGFFAALLIVPIVLGFVGGATEVTIIRPLYNRNLIYSLLVTFGLLLVIREIIRIFWGVAGRTFNPPDLLEFSVPLVIINYPAYRLFVILMTAVIALAVWIFLHRTDLGMIVRAATENRDMVKALGINISVVFTLVFALGTAIAGIAGVLHAPLISLYPTMGASIIVQSFVVVVIGGLNSFRGSIVAGLLVGEASALTYLVWPEATNVVIFLVMAAFLLLRPRGIFGQSMGGLE